MTMKRAFTLLEVNLAILVMAGGVLSIVVLYGLGFRESRQSNEDVASAAYADAVLSPLVMAISATNLKWSAFRTIDNYPNSKGGWSAYFNSKGEVDTNPEAKAQGAFSALMGKLSAAAKGSLNVSTQFPQDAAGGLKAALVVQHAENSPIIRLSFRAVANPGMLMSAPLYYTEARFQGLPDE